MLTISDTDSKIWNWSSQKLMSVVKFFGFHFLRDGLICSCSLSWQNRSLRNVPSDCMMGFRQPVFVIFLHVFTVVIFWDWSHRGWPRFTTTWIWASSEDMAGNFTLALEDKWQRLKYRLHMTLVYEHKIIVSSVGNEHRRSMFLRSTDCFRNLVFKSIS